MTSTASEPRPHPADQLRWPVSPALHVILDAEDRIQVEAFGRRAPVDDRTRLTEAIRQAHAQRRGFTEDAADPLLAADAHARVVSLRHDVIRQAILEAATRQLEDARGRLGIDGSYLGAIADDAMAGITPVLAQAITAAAGQVVRDIAGDAGWRHALGIVARQDDEHTAALASFVRHIAAQSLDSEVDFDGTRCDECGQHLDDGQAADSMIGRARELLGISTAPPEATAAPAPGDSAGAYLAAALEVQDPAGGE